MRTFVAILCLATVIACPYECAIRRVAAAYAPGEAIDACCEGCCSEHEDANSSQDESPQAPLPQEDGVHCFCEGALFCSASEADLDLEVQVVFVPWAESALAPKLVSRTLVHETLVPNLAILDSKSMRIALRSLQL
jgi:hypothetical protein